MLVSKDRCAVYQPHESLSLGTGYQLFFIPPPPAFFLSPGCVIEMTGEQRLCGSLLLVVAQCQQEMPHSFRAWGLPVGWLNRERLTHSASDERHQYHGSILVLNIGSQQD